MKPLKAIGLLSVMAAAVFGLCLPSGKEESGPKPAFWDFAEVTND